MDILDIKSKLQIFTVEFYNRMVADEQKRGYYRIVYYLYLLKKENSKIFDGDYLKTRTGIIWPGNEELMLQLVYLDDEGKQKLYKDKYWILLDKEKELVDKIYQEHRRQSFTHLKDLVNDDIKTLSIFNNMTLEEQMNMTIAKFAKQYQENPEKTMQIIYQILKDNNILQYTDNSVKTKVITPIKKVI